MRFWPRRKPRERHLVRAVLPDAGPMLPDTGPSFNASPEPRHGAPDPSATAAEFEPTQPDVVGHDESDPDRNDPSTDGDR